MRHRDVGLPNTARSQLRPTPSFPPEPDIRKTFFYIGRAMIVLWGGAGSGRFDRCMRRESAGYAVRLSK